jgi:two-component system, cell cycle response regulator
MGVAVNSDQQHGGLGRAFPGVTIASSGTQPAQQARAEASLALKLYVRGLGMDERQLLDGLVRVSQRRSPRLELLDEHSARDADVVLIDNGVAEASAWAKSQSWLKDKAVLWIGVDSVPVGHTLLHRPVQWSILPMQMARALEHSPGTAAWVEASRPSPLEPAATPVSRSKSPRPILVVDDSLAIRNYMRSLLEAGGFVVSLADSVQAALKLLSHQSFDCVMMDVLMPDIDGYEGCRQIKAMLRGAQSVPVVMLTSKSSPFDRIRGKMAGCDAYLTKPVDPKQLGEVLAQQLKASQDRATSSHSPLTYQPTEASSAQPKGMGLRMS